MLLFRDTMGVCVEPDVVVFIALLMSLFSSYRSGGGSAQRASWWHFNTFTWSGCLLSNLYLYEEAGYGEFDVVGRRG